jgi:hypothetical protein
VNQSGISAIVPDPFDFPITPLTRVDDQTSVQRLSGSSKLGEDHGSMPLDLTRDVLVGNQVHPVPRGSDETCVRERVHGGEFVRGDRGVHKVDGHKLDRSELTVDLSDQLFRQAPQVLVLLHVLSRRNGKLEEDDLSDPLGVLVQETLDGVKFLRDSLDVIQSIDSDDDLDTLETFLQLSQPFGNDRLFQSVDKLHGLDSDRESTDVGVSSFEPETVGHGLQSEDPRTRGQEVSSVIVSVESAGVR